MLEEKGFLPLGFLKAGGVQTGDHAGMRYRMIRDDDRIRAWVWQEPFAFDATDDSAKDTAEFPFSEEGRLTAITWIRAQYEAQRERWESAPSLLTAFSTR